MTELERVTLHILIRTPQVLLNNYDRLKLHKLESVVVDEVDCLIERVPNLSDKKLGRRLPNILALLVSC